MCQVKGACWTAPTANANHEYKASTWAWTDKKLIEFHIKNH